MKTEALPGNDIDSRKAMRSKILFDFGIFFIFFAFYVGAALVQTPLLKDIASIPVMGAPLGLLLSLMIFPVSWILIVIWFRRSK